MASLQPQNTIQIFQWGPQIWLDLNSSMPLVHNDMGFRYERATRAMPYHFHFPYPPINLLAAYGQLVVFIQPQQTSIQSLNGGLRLGLSLSQNSHGLLGASSGTWCHGMQMREGH